MISGPGPSSLLPSTNDWTLDKDRQSRRLGWWHKLTTPAKLANASSYVEREAARKSRLLSTIAFFLLLIDLILIPATLFIPNHYVVMLCVFVFLVCVLTMVFNRANKILFASFLLVSVLELTLIAIVATTIPFDLGNLPLYDLLIIAELFTASLLPPAYILVSALFNILFICGETFLQKTYPGLATPVLHGYLQTQFYAALARPVALQIIVGAVIYLWVRSTSEALRRADRAEMIAKLEHQIAEQKKDLEAGIQQILHTHSQVANGRLDARTPMTQDNILWPLANALNTLLTRLQRANKAEQEMQQIQKLLLSLTSAVQEAEQRQVPLPFVRGKTGTMLDPLLQSLSGKRVSTPSHPNAQVRE